MKIIFAYPPGRFPTVVYDPGETWDALSGMKGITCGYFNGNVEWWRLFCSTAFVEFLSGRLPLQEIISGKLPGKFTPATLARIALLAGDALSRMQDKRNFASVERYAETLEPLSSYVRLTNFLQPEFRVTFNNGPEVNGLDYLTSSEMVEYAGRDTLLSKSIDETSVLVQKKPDLCFLSVTSPYDLLTSLILAKCLRRRYPDIYLSILSHSYENFSLDNHGDNLVKTGGVLEVVDSIVKFNFQKDKVAVDIVKELQAGRRPKGFIERSGSLSVCEPAAKDLPLVEAFSPEPIFWMRLSDKKCYWGRCVFCAQNAKHKAGGIPSEVDIDRSLSRIEKLIKRGYGYFYFCDEAVPPRLLEYLSDIIIKKKMVFKWACRCRIEPEYTEYFFRKLKAAGCYEVLFGLESVTPRVQQLMRKYDHTVDECCAKSIIDSASRAGLGIHLTFIVGFPGERLEETKATLVFLAKGLKNVRRSTYYINNFTLYAQSAVYENPGAYGIIPGVVHGDIGTACGYSFCAESMGAEDKRIWAALPELVGCVETELGWAKFHKKHETILLRDLYFNYGHGAYLKSMEHDIFIPKPADRKP